MGVGQRSWTGEKSTGHLQPQTQVGTVLDPRSLGDEGGSGIGVGEIAAEIKQSECPSR